MRVGTIKHDHDAGEYRYYESWRIRTPNGTRQELHELIAKKLGELNNTRGENKRRLRMAKK
jgi:hypothetical protein